LIRYSFDDADDTGFCPTHWPESGRMLITISEEMSMKKLVRLTPAVASAKIELAFVGVWGHRL
jgi:hypothetical protein